MWKSKHIFIHDYQLIDIFLKDYLLPYINKVEVSYFFIRYWDGGPHIRLRYKNHKSDFEEGLEKVLLEFQTVYKEHSFFTVSYDPAIVTTEKVLPTEPFPNFSIQNIDYIPEVSRYGGKKGMILSEELFECSSMFANQIIQKLTLHQRYVITIDIMYKCAEIAKELGYFDSFGEFFHGYRDIWIQFDGGKFSSDNREIVINRVKRLKNGEYSSLFYDAYLQKFRCIIDKIQKQQTTMSSKFAYYIVISHIHMLNNRLGISPEFEFLFSNIFCEMKDYLDE